MFSAVFRSYRAAYSHPHHHHLSLRTLWCVANSSESSLKKALIECQKKLQAAIQTSSPIESVPGHIPSPQNTHAVVLATSSYAPEELDDLPRCLSTCISNAYAYTSSYNPKSKTVSTTTNPLLQDKASNTVASTIGATPSNIIGATVNQVYSSRGTLVDKGVSVLFFDSKITSKVLPSLDHLKVIPFGVDAGFNRKELSRNSIGKWHLPESMFTSIHTKPIIQRNIESSNINSRSDTNSRFWDSFESVSKAELSLKLPDPLEDLVLSGANMGVEFVLMVSDKDPHQFLELLDMKFPVSSKLGIIGCQTPFVNGLEYTLFNNNSVVSNGIYGFAFCRDPKITPGNSTDKPQNIPRIKVEYPNTYPIGRSATITKCKGNIILQIGSMTGVEWFKSSIDTIEFDSNPNKKDLVFYLKVSDALSTDNNNGTEAVLKITAGDPGRGALSVDTLSELRVGQKIQVLVTNSPTKGEPTPPTIPATSHEQIKLVCFETAPPFELRNFIELQDPETANKDNLTHQPSKNHTTTCPNLSELFGGSSELGFYYGSPYPYSDRHPKHDSKDKAIPFSNIVGECSTVCNVPFSASSLVLKKVTQSQP